MNWCLKYQCKYRNQKNILTLDYHLHNGSKFSNKGENLGNLTGQNFSENAFEYDHRIMILNINGQEYCKHYEFNPYAFNFYSSSTYKR